MPAYKGQPSKEFNCFGELCDACDAYASCLVYIPIINPK